MTRPDDAPPPPKPLKPARPPGAVPPAARSGGGRTGTDADDAQDREARDRGAAEVPRPTPVRAAMDSSPAADVPTEECTLEVDGATWNVRVLGRSRAGVGTVGTRLLLLAFTPPDQAQPDREALVVGTSLDGLPDGALDASWRAARPPRPDGDRSSPLFAGATGDRRKRQ